MHYGIVLTVADEGPAQLEFCLRHLRDCAPHNPVRVVSDGVDDPTYAPLCQRYNVTYTLDQYLKRIECGGRWWERVLREGLATETPWFIKIEPDTRFWSQFKTAPRYPVSGCLSHVGEMTEAVSGGCQSFTREAAEKILASDLIHSDALSELWIFCPDKSLIHLWYPLGHLALDYSMMFMLRTLDIEFGPWHEIGSRQKTAPPNYDWRYSVTHPHKLTECYHAGVAAETPIRIITTCMGRLEHLKQTLPTWLEDQNVTVLVVDWSCPNKTAEWVQSLKDPRVTVVSVPGKTRFNLAAARNAGAFHAAKDFPDGKAELSRELWAFVDADVLVEPQWANEVRRTFREGHYHVSGPLTRNMGGTVVLRPASYFAAGGYDETLQGWGCDDTLCYLMLRQNGIRAATWPGEYAAAIRHTDVQRTKHYDIKDKRTSNRIFDHYYRLKLKYMMKVGYLPSVTECKSLYEEAVTRDYQPGTMPLVGS